MTFTCPYHNELIADDNQAGCSQCIEAYTNGPDPATMTPDARFEELERIGRCMTTNSRIWHPRLDALVGRSVMTHEIGLRWDALLEEARNRTGVMPVDDVLGCIDDRVVVVMVPDA